MQDLPAPGHLVAATADFLRREVLPALDGALAFQLRVAINALDLAARDLELRPDSDAAESLRLQLLLAHDGSLSDMNREMCAKLADGSFDLTTPGVTAHLWATTLAKLAIDQPNYASYKRALSETKQNEQA